MELAALALCRLISGACMQTYLYYFGMGKNHKLKRTYSQSLSIFVFLVSILVLANVLYAQEDSQVKAKKNFLWSVETEENTVYLLGSIHMLNSAYYPLRKKIEKSYEQSKKIVFEIDIDEANNSVFQTKILTFGLYTNGQTLEKNISAQTYRLLQERVAAAGLHMSQFDRLKPWFCALTLTVIEFSRLGFDPNYGIDKYFFDKAKRDEKDIIYLETVEYQIDMLTTMLEEEQEKFLRQTLEDLKVIETIITDIVQYWENGDANKLDALLRINFSDYPDIYNRIFVQRNIKWVEKIEDLTRQNENVLVVVGAGHLVGAEGVVELLRKRGYTVQQR